MPLEGANPNSSCQTHHRILRRTQPTFLLTLCQSFPLCNLVRIMSELQKNPPMSGVAGGTEGEKQVEGTRRASVLMMYLMQRNG